MAGGVVQVEVCCRKSQVNKCADVLPGVIGFIDLDWDSGWNAVHFVSYEGINEVFVLGVHLAEFEQVVPFEKRKNVAIHLSAQIKDTSSTFSMKINFLIGFIKIKTVPVQREDFRTPFLRVVQYRCVFVRSSFLI